MRRIVRLTESDLTRIVKRVIKESKYIKPTGMPRWFDVDKGRYIDDTDIENFDTDYYEEEFGDYDSFAEKHPDATKHFQWDGADKRKEIFGNYIDKYGPMKVINRRSMEGGDEESNRGVRPSRRGRPYTGLPNAKDYGMPIFDQSKLGDEEYEKKIFDEYKKWLKSDDGKQFDYDTKRYHGKVD
jgi:hypothetical protein